MRTALGRTKLTVKQRRRASYTKSAYVEIKNTIFDFDVRRFCTGRVFTQLHSQLCYCEVNFIDIVTIEIFHIFKNTIFK